MSRRPVVATVRRGGGLDASGRHLSASRSGRILANILRTARLEIREVRVIFEDSDVAATFELACCAVVPPSLPAPPPGGGVSETVMREIAVEGLRACLTSDAIAAEAAAVHGSGTHDSRPPLLWLERLGVRCELDVVRRKLLRADAAVSDSVDALILPSVK